MPRTDTLTYFGRAQRQKKFYDIDTSKISAKILDVSLALVSLASGVPKSTMKLSIMPYVRSFLIIERNVFRNATEQLNSQGPRSSLGGNNIIYLLLMV